MTSTGIHKITHKARWRFFPAVLLLSILFLSSGSTWADEILKLDSDADRIGYSLGQQIGRDFKRQKVELDKASFLRGFEDASRNAEPVMGREELNAILGGLKGRINTAQRAEAKERRIRKQKEAEEKRRKGQAFMIENAEKPGVKTLPSGLQYKVIRPGSGKKPGPRDVVKVHYRAWLINGHEFDSSYSSEDPASFYLNGVIPGWTEALQLMREGAKWELYLPPELAYGSRGPLADQTVIYEIELLGVGEDGQGSGPRSALNAKQQ